MPLEILKSFAPETAKKTSVVSRAVLFGILTATRVQEFLCARWDEIDIQRATWTIPASRMKCGLEHRVPLSRQALAVLERCERKSELVFPAPRSDKEMVIDSLGLYPEGDRRVFHNARLQINVPRLVRGELHP